jgi:hypothetical protein
VKKGMMTLLIIIGSIVMQWAILTRAEGAYLSDIVLTSNQDNLLVHFTVEECFTDEMNEVIEKGIEVTFTFFVKLNEKRGLWLDKEIADLEFRHTIKYDNLKEIYEVRLSERKDERITVKNFDEAKRLMSDVVALRVTSIDGLREGDDYQLRVMAELDKIRLPFYLHYVLFFLSLWDFETGWHAIDFRY